MDYLFLRRHRRTATSKRQKNLLLKAAERQWELQFANKGAEGRKVDCTLYKCILYNLEIKQVFLDSELSLKKFSVMIDTNQTYLSPVESYTNADLDWNDKRSRSSVEMNDPKSRPAIQEAKKNIADYDVIFIGYPIWWNLAPRIIDTFIETHHLAGKTLIPFATSGGSGITNSVGALKKAYPDLNWKEGKLLNRMDENGIREWIGKTSKD